MRPNDDEPLTPEDVVAIKEAADDFARGDTVSWEAYLAGRRSRG